MRLCCALKIAEQNSIYRNYPTDTPDEIISPSEPLPFISIRLRLSIYERSTNTRDSYIQFSANCQYINYKLSGLYV